MVSLEFSQGESRKLKSSRKYQRCQASNLASKLSTSISGVKQTALHLSLSSHQRQIKTPLVKTKFSNYLDTVELTRI